MFACWNTACFAALKRAFFACPLARVQQIGAESRTDARGCSSARRATRSIFQHCFLLLTNIPIAVTITITCLILHWHMDRDDWSYGHNVNHLTASA